jgi:2-oxoisovalerate dehydrogenase E1 component
LAFDDAFITPLGIYPNNAIVGGSGSIAPARRSLNSSTKTGRGLSTLRRLHGLRPFGKALMISPWTRCYTLGEDGGAVPKYLQHQRQLLGMGGQTRG